MIITVCGSSKFKNEILAVAHDLTLQGHIVLAPCVFHHTDEEHRENDVARQEAFPAERLFAKHP